MAFWQNFPSVQSKLNATNLNGLAGGWTRVIETLTYTSADAPTFVANTSTDLRTYISVGMKLKLTQTTEKYFIVTAITSTTITLYGGTDYTLTNTAISEVFFSVHKAPYGFPLNPNKWSVIISISSNLSQGTPSVGVWYNLGSTNISVPIGEWNLSYAVLIGGFKTSTTSFSAISTLSTSATTPTDNSLTGEAYIEGALGTLTLFGDIYKTKSIIVTSKTLYYLLGQGNGNTLTFYGATTPIIIKAVSVYL